MVTVNGRPDTEETAHAIVIRILNESIVKHYGTRPGNDEVKELSAYVKKELEEIVEYVAERERRRCDCSREGSCGNDGQDA